VFFLGGETGASSGGTGEGEAEGELEDDGVSWVGDGSSGVECVKVVGCVEEASCVEDVDSDVGTSPRV
jgi:hypothetical protein